MFKGKVAKTVLLAAVVMVAAFAGSTQASAAGKRGYASYFSASSSDGSKVLFTTRSKLTPEDRDEFNDLYLTENGRTRLVTKTPKGGRESGGMWETYAAADEPRIVFTTDASFSPLDRDRVGDVYEARGDQVKLLTEDSLVPGGCPPKGCSFWAYENAGNGDVVFVGTKLRLTPEDTDDSMDAYSLEDDRFTLVTGGPRAGGGDSADIEDQSLFFEDDGSAVYFSTTEPLVAEDQDGSTDAYVWTREGTRLLSPWPTTNDSVESMYAFPSERVEGRYFLATNASFPGGPGEDITAFRKLYMVENGVPTFLAGSQQYPSLQGESPDGESVYFVTDAALTPDDRDRIDDIYVARNGSVELFSKGPRGSGGGIYTSGDNVQVEAVTSDGTVYFKTVDQLVGLDDDSYEDLYKKKDGAVELLTVDERGSHPPSGAAQVAVLEDGAKIVVSTYARWSEEDRNDVLDIYVIEGDRRRMISKGQIGPSHQGWHETWFDRHLGGDRYVFSGPSRFRRDDGDIKPDAYFVDLSRENSTRLITDGELRTTAGPLGNVTEGPASFRFRLSGAKPRFLCSMDEAKYRKCAPGVTYRGLKPGLHRFRVVSVGPVGLGRSVFAERIFRVKRKQRIRDHGVSMRGVSADGRRVLFETKDRLVKADRDDSRDFYLREGSKPPRLIAGAGSERAQLRAASPDLRRLLLATTGRLTASDQDQQWDTYESTVAGSRLLPAGLALFDRPLIGGASADARTILFSTRQSLSPADTDQGTDVYTSGPEGIELISTGTRSDGDAYPVAISENGEVTVFRTKESLDPRHKDGDPGLYRVEDGVVSLVTAIGKEQDHMIDPAVVAVSRDGSTLVLESNLKLLPEDKDKSGDIYVWRDGSLQLVSTGDPSGGGGNNVALESYSPILAEPEVSPFYPRRAAVSADGDTIVFHSTQRLSKRDRNEGTDVYVWRNGTRELLIPSKGRFSETYFQGASRDFRKIVVSSDAGLVKSDRDGYGDIYRVVDGRAQRITSGPGGRGLPWIDVVWVSPDASAIALVTKRKMVPGDKDRFAPDLYMWKNGRVELLTKSKAFDGIKGRLRAWTGAKGKTFYVSTRTPLTAGDRDETIDIYRLTPRGPKKVS